jgi:hypothetical protein
VGNGVRYGAVTGEPVFLVVDMRTNPTASAGRLGRLGGLAAAAAVAAALASLAAGCGGHSASPGIANLGTTSTTAGSSNAPSTGGGGAAEGQAGSGGRATLSLAGGNVADMTKFSACMRSHGVPNFPDPSAQGGISITPSMGIDPGSSQFQAAQSACQKLMPKGTPPSPAQQARMQAQALKFSACMRSHGVPKFPDPTFGNGGVGIKISGGSGIDPTSPQFQAAQKACQKDLPGLVTHGNAAKAVSGG